MRTEIIPAIVATVVMFGLGAVWYMFLFGKQWGQIHGFDTLTPEQQNEMRKKVGPLYLFQLVVTLLTALVYGYLLRYVSGIGYFKLAGLLWLGFVMPTQVSAVLFGGTEPQWILKKILIMSGYMLVNLMALAAIFKYLS